MRLFIVPRPNVVACCRPKRRPVFLRIPPQISIHIIEYPILQITCKKTEFIISMN